MPSLKEIKARISSVKTTRKIVQARQMISSGELHRAQAVLSKADACLEGLGNALKATVASTGTLPELAAAAQPGTQSATPGTPTARSGSSTPAASAISPAPAKILVVALASNGGMCGGFNLAIQKEVAALPKTTEVIPVGTMLRKFMLKSEIKPSGDFDPLAGKSTYADLLPLADSLVQRFEKGELAQIDLIYQRFETVSRRTMTRVQLLPIPVELPAYPTDEMIVEPGAAPLLREISLLYIKAMLFRALVSNRASENAARMLAMQAATDNADDLIDDQQLLLNKLRQEKITSELSDIVGSSFV